MPPIPKTSTRQKKSTTSAGSASSQSQSNGKDHGVNAPPQWPAMTPCGHKDDLTLHHVYPNQILTIPQFWTPSLCKKYVNFLSNLPLTTTPGKPKRGEAVRVNDRYQVQDPAFAKMLWSETALRDIVLETELDGHHDSDHRQMRQDELWGGEPLGLNPNIRIYRYTPGQYFDQHYDDSNNIIFPSDPPVQAKTTWTLLLYLTSATDGCKGGSTVFYPEPAKRGKTQANPEPVVCELETGMALLHRHGAECMLHEGREVTEGYKWVIRSDLCVRR